MKRFISYNGKIKEEVFTFGTSNRSFRYGDGLFESIRLYKGVPLFFSLHFQRLERGIALLGMKYDDSFTEKRIFEEIQFCAAANGIFESGRIRLQIFRKDGGLYKPSQNGFDYFIEIDNLENPLFSLQNKGLHIDIFRELPKPLNILSSIKTTNALYYVLAGVFANNNNLDDAILINGNNLLVEATSSNLFMVKDNTVLTPPLNDGPVEGIIRSIILKLDLTGYYLKETSITAAMLEKADEVFLSNAIHGVQWVVGYGSKRYYNKVSKKIIDLLNQQIDLTMFADAQ